MESKYTFELWSRDGNFILGLSRRASNRNIVLTRNEAEDIRWTINLVDLEHYCRQANIDVRTLIIPGQTEIRVRRGGQYICGGQVIYTNIMLDDKTQTLEIRANGFLNLLKDRFTTRREFVNTSAAVIVNTLINEVQAEQYGSFGITIDQTATIGPQSRVYVRQRLKDIIQDLSKSTITPFDFNFSEDKKFSTYQRYGSDRPDIVMSYPGNIRQLSVPNDATNIGNRVIALGSGNGDATQATYTDVNLDSQATYSIREHIISSSAEDNATNALTDLAKKDTKQWAFPFEIPALTVDLNQPPFITDFSVGDRVAVSINGFALLDHINGLYRIERISLNIDDNDNETATLEVSI